MSSPYRECGRRAPRAIPGRSFSAVWALGLGVAAIALAGCKGEEPSSSQVSRAGHSPVIHAVNLAPDPLTLGMPISVTVDATDPDRAPLTFTYQWIVNDQPLAGETKSTLPPSRLKRGDRVSVSVAAFDGVMSSTPVRTATHRVVNTPPAVTLVAIDPDSVPVGGRAQAKVEVSDADGDAVTLSFRWRTNGALYKETAESELDTSELEAGDLLQVEVVPRDAQGPGQGLLSSPVYVRSGAPKVLSQPQTVIIDGRYEYAVRAAVSEGEGPLRYSLGVAPQGMIINKETGLIVWQATAGQVGNHMVKIVVQDRQGATALQEFRLTLHAPPAS